MAYVDAWLDAEMRNWASWCWSGPWPHPLPMDHAASLEGKYLPPSDLYRDDVLPAQPRPDRKRAEVVQGVYLNCLSANERWTLCYRYVYRIGDREAMRRMKVTAKVHETIMLDAVRMVGRAFPRNEKTLDAG